MQIRRPRITLLLVSGLVSVRDTHLFDPTVWEICSVGKSESKSSPNCLAASEGRLNRYSHMDFILFSAVKGGRWTLLVISYDIACQWCKNLHTRMLGFPETIRVDENTVIVVGIPKFHLHGHGPDCQTRYSFNFMVGAGRTCGETVETEWSVINIVSLSTREMSYAARHETLNDHWGHWNWRKVVDLGTFVDV
jgi:hypothetical protein